MTVDVYNSKREITDKIEDVHLIKGFSDGSFFLYTNDKGVEQVYRVPPERLIIIQ